ncbi:MAG: phenylacetate--CoA ligase family protein [Thiobacillaceae bacterium]
MINRLRNRLHRYQRPARYRHLETLLHSQGMCGEALLKKQQQDLADIVTYAAANTRYYAEAFRPFLANGRFTITDLPALHKEDVARHLDDLLTQEVSCNVVKVGHTGGSTGKPLSFYYDDAKHELMRAGMMRSYMLSGWAPGQKILNFWGAQQDVAPGGVFGAPFYNLTSLLCDFAAAERTIAAHEYTERQLIDWGRFVQSYQPVLLQGYASVLAELARVVIKTRMPMPRTILGVYTTAEVLNDWQRTLMESAFGCKVFNQYGSREIPNIACECRCGNLHVFTDMVYLESLNLDNEDRLLVTSLTNRLMPFIRYDIGDSGRLRDGECACGLPFPMMEMTMCRQNDLIRTKTGKTIHPSYFNRLLYGQTQISRYQWVQRELDTMALNLVTTEKLGDEMLASLCEQIRRDIDPDMRLEVNYLNDIPRTTSGKHRFVIGLGQRQH